jgi:hypothetical protein
MVETPTVERLDMILDELSQAAEGLKDVQKTGDCSSVVRAVLEKAKNQINIHYNDIANIQSHLRPN